MTTAQKTTAAAAAEVIGGTEDPGGVKVSEGLMALARAATHSQAAVRATIGLSAEAVRIALGRSDVAPAKGDNRFADPSWTENPGYRRIKQGYLAWSSTIDSVVDAADVDWRTKERARFAAGILTSSVAPTNVLPGNPAALKRAIETGGGSLLAGAKNWVDDLLHNGGMPKQVDSSAFTVGENLAVTPGAVVFRNEVFELLQYQPATPTVRARPVLLIPPPINKYYFLDLAPGRSFIEHAVAQGLQFFVISWRNPKKEHAGWDLDTYAQAVLDAIDAACEISGSDSVNALGMCAGGIVTSTVLSHLAAVGDGRVNSVSFGVTLLDWDCQAMVGAFQSQGLLSVARRKSRSAGVLDARSLGSVFTWMRPNELVWNYWVNNYLMGKKPPAFDILAWNDDKTNLPGALHGQFLDIFAGNLLTKPGSLEVLGTPVDLSQVKIDNYVTGGLSDHLTPWDGCYRATQLLPGHSTFVLSPTGHIQTQVSPPGNPKSHYFVGGEPGPDPHEWRATAERRQGTWWDHWVEWVTARAGDEKPAPAKLGSRRHKILDPAPGTYVLETA
jgi:poly[(R)-3-hydroxyalkanoate] polymerase subunit PhaC